MKKSFIKSDNPEKVLISSRGDRHTALCTLQVRRVVLR